MKIITLITFFALSTGAICAPRLVLDKNDSVVLTDKTFFFYATVSDFTSQDLMSVNLDVECLNGFAKPSSIKTHVVDYYSGYISFRIDMTSNVDTRGAIIYFPCTVSSDVGSNDASIRVEDSVNLTEKL
jgi:hypothetical protein